MSNSNQANPVRLANNTYFGKHDPDPYTVLNYWRRRYCSDAQYLQCAYYPWPDCRFYRSGYLVAGNKAPCGGGFCQGWVNRIGEVGDIKARTTCGAKCFDGRT